MSKSTHLPRRSRQQDPCRPRLLRLEPLEDRRLLSATRAADAINLFAYDVYEHMQNESGNLFFSPLSIATGLAMTYAGAAGQTASEMEQVLHLGTPPGIHSSFSELLAAFEAQTNPSVGFELTVANAIWPQLGLSVVPNFVDTIETDYRGHVENLNYGNPELAKDIINSWVEDATNGKIEDLISDLSPDTAMVLTNSVYFKALWDMPFDPQYTGDGEFSLANGETIETPMMFTPVWAARTWLDDYQVIDLPFEGGAASMILLLPRQHNTANELTPEDFSQLDAWLDGEREIDQHELRLPKFQTTVETDLRQLLVGMGMPTAFGAGADFSEMTPAEVFISKVFHKATIEVNEQGTEAAAATSIELPTCFAAGTPVLTPDGEKPIEQLKAGDFVLARDEYNLEGGVEPKMVERLLCGEADILNLHIGGQIIRTTATHPFFVRGRGWTPAGEIKVEDRLSTSHGDWIEVEKVLHTDTSQAVYNLRVADHRTYFIGSKAWGFAVWAHNFYDAGFYADHPFHFMIRDNVTSTISFMGRIDDPSQLQNSLNPAVEESSGDFDGDGDVDGRDFLAWQRGYGATTGAQLSSGDSNSDGDVDAGDLQVWQTSYGQSAGPQLAALADAALEDSEFIIGGLTDGSWEGEPLGIERQPILESVSDPIDVAGISAQSRRADGSISSRGRYSDTLDNEGAWLDDEMLERVFG